MPLEIRDLRAGDEDVLSSSSSRLLLLDLYFHDIGRVLDDLGDVGAVSRADFTKNSLVHPDDTTDKPVSLSTNRTISTYERVAEVSNLVLTQKTPIVLAEQYGGLSGSKYEVR
jgi:hypothetical protein